eukprot:CAMPEP_0183740238 /NCGR_PEP_ID=MMETSP0737-20130205/59056_1 /TAXON_ID=385413 /ORGANISM="Thalassiosira miniscula, Strain CCMP1093" /LENGTH=80 /DNA_ID=CAMNT_0025975239 /DNA_START=362 /DNA_END=601 /DNA_ORIENTATION=-
MTSVETWLTHWVLAINNETKYNENGRFNCYAPIDMQSGYVGFTHPNAVDGDMKSIQQKFTVIGPVDDLDRVLCVIFIHYT